MLAYRQQQALYELQQDEKSRSPAESDSIIALDCWKLDQSVEPYLGSKHRLTELVRGPRTASNQQGLELTLRQWLHSEKPYNPLPPSANHGKLRGAMRIILCDRPNLRVGMAMSYRCFSLINESFQLHQATLPLFCADHGGYAFFMKPIIAAPEGSIVSIVMKFPQKAEIANYTLSLTYNLNTGCTKALICGAGVITDRKSDGLFGSQRQQLVDAILLTPHAWDNPLFLPFILLDNYIARLDWRAHHVDLQLSRLESRLGVTFVGKSGRQHERKRWPEGINTEEANIDVQTISTHLAYLKSRTQWVQDCLLAFIKACSEASDLKELQDKEIDMLDLTQSAETLLSITKGVYNRFSTYSVRANLQSNVLFNIISQQENIATRQDTKLSFHIAKSSKQDSTSLMTFTFITALFLPGTFIATVFSMSMFDFNPSNGAGTGDGTPSMAATPQTYVSNKFWLFWVIAIPLTLITMATWYFWSRYANRRWQEELQQAMPSVKEDTELFDMTRSSLSTRQTSNLEDPDFPSFRRRSVTAGVHGKDEIRRWWTTPGLV